MDGCSMYSSNDNGWDRTVHFLGGIGAFGGSSGCGKVHALVHSSFPIMLAFHSGEPWSHSQWYKHSLTPPPKHWPDQQISPNELPPAPAVTMVSRTWQNYPVAFTEKGITEGATPVIRS